MDQLTLHMQKKKKVEEQKKKLEPYMLPYTKMCVEIKHRLKCKS